nr:small ubiquitin-related modifier 2-like [Pongo pygmaeus]
MADKKPQERVKTENNNHLNLKVVGQGGSVVQFKIKRHTLLSKLMKAYCELQLEMENEDTIDVFQQQMGGVYSEGNLLLHSRTLFLQTTITFSKHKGEEAQPVKLRGPVP